MGSYKAFRIQLDLQREIKKLSKAEGVSESDFIRNAVRKEILLRRFDELNARLVPKARAMGIFTDEDAFKLMEDMT